MIDSTNHSLSFSLLFDDGLDFGGKKFKIEIDFSILAGRNSIEIDPSIWREEKWYTCCEMLCWEEASSGSIVVRNNNAMKIKDFINSCCIVAA